MESLESSLGALQAVCQEEKALAADLVRLDREILQLTRLVSRMNVITAIVSSS